MLTVMSQNVQYGADQDGRWDGTLANIRSIAPQLLLLQEVDFLADPDKARAAEKAMAALAAWLYGRPQVVPDRAAATFELADRAAKMGRYIF